MPRVNPEILRWARETAGLSPAEAVKKIQLSKARGHSALERLARLESGEEQPTRAMLARMAKQYRRPLVAFYLSTPPRSGDRGNDFRTLPADHVFEDDAHLDVLLRIIQARQSMVRSVLEEEDEAVSLPFVGAHTTTGGIAPIVEALRAILSIELGTFRGAQDQNAAFAFLREAAESAGVFVLLMGDLGSHHTAIEPSIFRGFALADEVAPFIVINDRDSRAAWCFTLLHEMVHLLLGQTGVSSQGGDQVIELFCNDAASEFLLPAGELAQFHGRAHPRIETLAAQISEFARPRKVSSTLVAYRLHRTGRLNFNTWSGLRDFFREKWREQKENERKKNRSSDGGPSYYMVRKHRLGHRLLDLANRMVASGALSTSKASLLLGVKPPQVELLLGT